MAPIDAQLSPASCTGLLNLSVVLADVGLVVDFSDHWQRDMKAQCKGKPQRERGKQLGLS